MFWCRWYQKKVLRNTRCHGKGLAPRCPGHYQLAAFLIARQVLLNAEPESVVWHLSKIGSVDTCSQAKKGICSPVPRRSCDNSRFGKMCSDCRWEFSGNPFFRGPLVGQPAECPRTRWGRLWRKFYIVECAAVSELCVVIVIGGGPSAIRKLQCQLWEVFHCRKWC